MFEILLLSSWTLMYLLGFGTTFGCALLYTQVMPLRFAFVKVGLLAVTWFISLPVIAIYLSWANRHQVQNLAEHVKTLQQMQEQFAALRQMQQQFAAFNQLSVTEEKEDIDPKNYE